MDQTFINSDTVCYGGQYIALRAFNDPIVIAHGLEPKVVYEKAVSSGCSEPVIAFVPPKGIVQVY